MAIFGAISLFFVDRHKFSLYILVLSVNLNDKKCHQRWPPVQTINWNQILESMTWGQSSHDNYKEQANLLNPAGFMKMKRLMKSIFLVSGGKFLHVIVKQKYAFVNFI